VSVFALLLQLCRSQRECGPSKRLFLLFILLVIVVLVVVLLVIVVGGGGGCIGEGICALVAGFRNECPSLHEQQWRWRNEALCGRFSAIRRRKLSIPSGLLG
jgi:hypothetical protein